MSLPASRIQHASPPEPSARFGIRSCLVNYWSQALDFSGRATRREFLVPIVANLAVGLFLALINAKLTTIYSVVTLIPSLSLFVRRCHDSGRSALPLIAVPALMWFAALVSCRVPLLPVLLIVACLGMALYATWVVWCIPGDRHHNQYGPDPRE